MKNQPPSAVGFAQDVQSIEGDPVSVKNYFNGKSWKNYFIQLDRPENLKYLNKLRSGQYNMLKYTSKESGKTFYMFGKGEIDVNKPEMVFPVN